MINVEVDQSGKIEDFEIGTILAFSNGCQKAILIPSSVKLVGLNFLRQRRISRKTRYLRMLAAGFFLLLKNDLINLNIITIDIEFSGREEDIRGILLNLIWRKFPTFSKEHLIFTRIGKKSPAHHLAWATFRGKRQVDKVISKEEFIEVLK